MKRWISIRQRGVSVEETVGGGVGDVFPCLQIAVWNVASYKTFESSPSGPPTTIRGETADSFHLPPTPSV